MARAMAAALRCPTDRAAIGAQMGYAYWVQWTGALGGFRRAQRLVPQWPLLFVYGRRKPFMFHSPGWVEEVAARPGSQVVAFDTGHWVMVEQPEEFNRTVMQWLSAPGPAADGAGAIPA
jgi:pimeloyl-ACP methyl ester carboxylesterase